MSKKIFNLFILAVVFMCFICHLFAQTAEEQEENLPEWTYTHYPVNSDTVSTYDINKNGILEPEETRKYLRERYDIIQSQGSTGVDMDLLQQYDADGDGSIDAREAEEIREDMQ